MSTNNTTDTNGNANHDPTLLLPLLLQQHLQATILKPIHPSTIEEDETTVRKCNSAMYDMPSTSFNFKSIYLLILNTYSSLGIFVLHLISYESIISIALSVGLTLYIHFAILLDDDDNDNNSFNGNTMNWVLLTFAVITPIGAAIQMVFARRENALLQISVLRSTWIQLYNSYAVWGWEYQPYGSSSTGSQSQRNGRNQSKIDWLEHSDLALREILFICDDLTRDTRARHKMTAMGRNEAATIHQIHTRLLQSIVVRMGHLAEICETLKQEGLPPNESNRIRQWERGCLDAMERLRIIKVYRTPQGLRSFGRLFSMLLPPFYAPYYAQLAHDVNSLGVAITFAIFTALALTSLFETISQMEDPFDRSSILDGVDVQADLIDGFKPLLLALRSRYFPGCPPFKADM